MSGAIFPSHLSKTPAANKLGPVQQYGKAKRAKAKPRVITTMVGPYMTGTEPYNDGDIKSIHTSSTANNYGDYIKDMFSKKVFKHPINPFTNKDPNRFTGNTPQKQSWEATINKHNRGWHKMVFNVDAYLKQQNMWITILRQLYSFLNNQDPFKNSGTTRACLLFKIQFKDRQYRTIAHAVVISIDSRDTFVSLLYKFLMERLRDKDSNYYNIENVDVVDNIHIQFFWINSKWTNLRG